MNRQLNEVHFPIPKLKAFKASKKLTDEYHTSSVQIFPRMILLTVSGEHFLLQFVVSCDFTPNFQRIGEKSHEIETFHNLLKNSE